MASSASQKITTEYNHNWNFIPLYGLLFLIYLTPLPFGSNRPIWSALLALITGALLCVWAYSTIKDKNLLTVSVKNIRFIFFPFLAVLIWCLMQTLPIWPDSMTHPLWETTYMNFGVKGAKSISIDNYETIISTMKLLTYGGIFWLALQLGRSRRNAKKIFRSIAYAGSAYAAYGLFSFLSDSTEVLGFEKFMYQNSLTSTFINRNSYATYAGIGIVIMLSQFMSVILENTSRVRGRMVYKTILTNITTKGHFFLELMVLLITALILTNSRAGLISCGVGIITFFTMALFTEALKKRRKFFFSLLSIVFVVFIWMVSIGAGVTLQRFDYITKDIETRNNIYSITANAIDSHLYTGSGLGTFEDIFRLYKDDSLKNLGSRRVDHAHNTYLETILEIGLPAFCVIAISFITMILVCFRGVITRSRGYFYPITGIAVSALVGVHALFDFSLEMPAIALTYATIMGVCCAQSWSSKDNMGLE